MKVYELMEQLSSVPAGAEVRVHRLMTLKEFTQLEIVDGGTDEDCYLMDGEISSVEADKCVATLYME
mgnify:CR=1 FL=1